MAKLRIEVVHALAGRQEVVELRLPEGATAGQAIAASGLGTAGMTLGIGGRAILPGRVLMDGDRVELLRPLAADPKDSRRLRARAARKKKPNRRNP